MSIIGSWAKAMSKVVSSSFEVSSAISNHGGLLGDARESFIRDVLERFLPSNVVVGSGQIADSKEGLSKQIDIIIYRNDFPVLRTFGSGDVYLIEGVIATIEVKSALTKRNLIEALENGKSVRNLLPTILISSLNFYCNIAYENDFIDLSIPQKNSIMGMVLPPHYIFSYKGYKATSYANLLVAVNKWFCDLKGGELDATILPEVICTEGCVGIKNLSNQLGLMDSNCTFAVKADESPLRYLISSLLENIFARMGQQQLGQTGIQYNLLDYHITKDMEGGWKGTAVDPLGLEDPKLTIFRKFCSV
ncbi:DUF6602 domain-containing protein [Geotalea sp. SG265]|uniref:DUF6602 domain-containing protein n=1 Tax=Geotalea sp. SG265 TaxID=2922867 RepID=UPI001FAFD989|nr:DUF6602 domain-containing protein [Geotalea sp. SG265]